MASISPFTVDNIPFGVISTDDKPHPRPATIIEDTVIDLQVLEDYYVFDNIEGYPHSQRPFSTKTLNAFAALPKPVRRSVREHIQRIWKERDQRQKYEGAFMPSAKATNHVPMDTINYTDYVSSRGHFENLQEMLNVPQHVRCPFYHMPTGYYGNSRNIVISGSPVYRFHGVIDNQFQKEVTATTGPSQRFDFELELGVYIAGNTQYGESVKLEDVDDIVFGFVLLNDWSARDIQRAESGGPTGPFLAKSGCVTISPWIVTLEALERSRTPRELQPVVEFVDYLHENSTHGQPDKPCLDIRCSATWSLANSGLTPIEVCRTEYKQTYWTHRQLVAHQTRNGSRIGTGDLLGTGTMSMFKSDEIGRCCLAEKTRNGTKVLELGSNQKRTWIEDGDEISFQGWVHDAESGKPLFGFGECRGVVQPLKS